MTKNDKDFMGYAICKLLSKNITISLERKSQVVAMDPGQVPFKCAGYFDEKQKILAVACRKPQKEYFPIFIHEFCHFEQWDEKSPLFFDIINNKEIDEGIWNFVNRKELKIPMKVVKASAKAWQALELDCEKRTVEHIKHFNLSIDLEDYIQSANIYVLFYTLLPKLGDWYINSPYDIKEIVNCVGAEFLDDYTILPDGFEELIMKNCF